MKKTGVINSEISALIARLGHTDTIVISDAGLPIPDQVKRIDLALKEGIPSFMDTLQTVLEEMCVQKAVIAAEMPAASPLKHQELAAALGNVPLETVSHEELKARTLRAKAVIRTGEFSPYANVILEAGVIF